ncbi:hypothetical protein [Bradyrhizobium sp. McL0616]|uniref:hypothetical protein n=1 Tax=Bradyrhizobium sp. McL0616 TaxID=3415674 RepID=UPI003CF13769
MLTLSGAKSAAASSARGQGSLINWLPVAVIVLALSGCMPATTPMTAADPADPAAKVARAGYRSTIAPYTGLRPATPAPWSERNGAAAPQAKQDQ